MKGYISFIIVVLAFMLVFSAMFFSSIKAENSTQAAMQKMRNSELDLSLSIEESAKAGAAAGAVFYILLIAAEPMPLEEIYSRIDPRELDFFAKKFAVLAICQLEERKNLNYAIFCIDEKFNEEEIEENMLEEGALVIPKSAGHFSSQNCMESVDVHVSLPIIKENKIVSPAVEDILSDFADAEITVYFPNPGRENGRIGISFVDIENKIALADALERRALKFKLGDIETEGIVALLSLGNMTETEMP